MRKKIVGEGGLAIGDCRLSIGEKKAPRKKDPRKGRGIKMEAATAAAPDPIDNRQSKIGNSGTGTMELRRLPISAIKPAAYNPRKDLTPADPEYQQIKASIAKFGLVEPLVWNERSGNLVGGYQRLKILTREFGFTEVEVSVVDLSLAEEKALNVGLNKLGGSWNEESLAVLLAGLQHGGEVDATLTGFTASDIDVLIASQAAQEVGTHGLDATEEGAARAERHAVLIECNSEAHRRKTFGACKKQGHSCVEALVGGGYWREAE